MSEPVRKTFDFKVLEQRKDGGRILINTASVDRDRDRVMPAGARTENYLKNPVVQWGHNYRDPWATVGKSNSLVISNEGIVADFTLRPAANDQDPQSVVLLLWNGGWVRTASIGFIPLTGKPNDAGGTDFNEWELLEWSIVPIPANQDALRLAVKGLGDQEAGSAERANALGLVLRNPHLTADAKIEALLKLAPEPSEAPSEPVSPDAPGRAWVRRARVESEYGTQILLVAFYRYKIDVPEDAYLLQMDPALGECQSIPHPDAGKTVWFRQAQFSPPLEFRGPWRDGDHDGVHALCERDCTDEVLIASPRNYWKVTELSEPLATIEIEKAWQAKSGPGYEFNMVTRSSVARAKAIGERLAIGKRGRVISAKNEQTLRSAQEDVRSADGKIGDVLKQLDEQPAEQDGKSIQQKGAIPTHTTPKADPDTAWDGPAVVADCPSDRTKLRLIHAWVDDAGDPDAKQSYKFPHHLVDGRVVLRGVNNAMSRLPQASIPEGDRAGVERHLKHHQDQFSEGASAEDDSDDKEVEAVLLDLKNTLTTLVKEVIS